MEVIIHYERELAKLVKQAHPSDKVALGTTIKRIQQSGLRLVQTKTIRKGRGLQEPIIDAENKYRIFFSVRGTDVHLWSYCKKTSPAVQDRAIDRALQRMARQH